MEQVGVEVEESAEVRSPTPPVPLDDYIASIQHQSLRKLKVRLPDICRALADLMLPPATLSQPGHREQPHVPGDRDD